MFEFLLFLFLLFFFYCMVKVYIFLERMDEKARVDGLTFKERLLHKLCHHGEVDMYICKDEEGSDEE